jgi:hypothetical protein
MHLIAMGIKARLNIPWVADFRDPWTNIDFYNELKLSSGADRKHRVLEKKVLTSADAVNNCWAAMTSEFKNMGCSNVYTITNGYDEILISTKRAGKGVQFSARRINAISEESQSSLDGTW